jgi:LysM repeat protein/lipoprotein-anchoring transpeptidase ErfK/SrfK
MRCLIVRSWSRVAPLGFACGSLFAQLPPALPPPVPPPPRIEPGLEEAVGWKWSIAPPETQAWGLPLPEALAPKDGGSPGAAPAPVADARPATHEVQKGDVIIKIARKYHMTPWQLKQFNGLKDDRIVIGQVLKIPTAAELLEMPPPPPPPEPALKRGAGKPAEEKPVNVLEGEPKTYEQLVMGTVLLQVFLDREMFSPGPIDGKSGPTFQQASALYQQAHADASDAAGLKAKALAAVKQPYTSYVLRAEDFKFIQPRAAVPAAIPVGKAATAAKKAAAAKKKGAKTPPTIPPLTYAEMVAADFLGYTSAWEFVAERFHCDEAFLHELNPAIKDVPEVGDLFQVPNVVPFEIERALEAPLQPAVDPGQPVTAAVVGLSRLEISRGGRLVAVMPVASARPGLYGRGAWTVLDAVPQPRLTTKREPREAPAATPPAADPALTAGQFLAAGPNNPVGILWIHLTKANSTEPLPYGLHGTSIPGRMRSLEGIGGFRLTNWDIARAVRLLPAGTSLQWKAP